MSTFGPEEIAHLLDRPIAFHRAFVEIGGSVAAALFLSQSVYWSRRTKDDDGWFWKTQEQWFEETGLSRAEQEGARGKLRQMGILVEKKMGLPCKLWFRIDFNELSKSLASITESQTSMRKSSRLDAVKVADSDAEYQQTITEITSETTTDIKRNTPPARKRAGSRAHVERPDDVSEQTWADFLELRKSKRAPLTATALAGIAREADKAGMSLQDAIALCCERGWQSINARWISEKSSGPYTGSAGGNGGGAGDWKEGWWHPVYDTPEEYIRSGWEIGQAERAAKRKQWEK
jgi:hypothetical protein